MRNIVLFDTAVGTGNKGDDIIMQSATRGLAGVLDGNYVINFPTHTVCFPFYQNYKYWRAMYVYNADIKIVCGTDLLKSNMFRLAPQWNINIFNCRPLKNTILMGVGNSGDKPPNLYTRKLYNRILSRDFIHSTRDEATKEMVEELGYRAINTGCPTLWGLTEQHCSQIPTEKANAVVFSLTDTKINRKYDQALIDMLRSNYEKLYYWPQTVGDMPYFRSMENIEKIDIIPPNLNSFSDVLLSSSIDYVGTRLHGGIFAMQHKKRAVILAVDHRARNIHKTNNINCVERHEIDRIESMVNSRFSTKVNVDYDSIDKWLAQFGAKLMYN